MLSLDEIRRALAAHRPTTLSVEGKPRAAVAVVLHRVERSPEVLFIERAGREGDPWSGQMAFPGGRVEVGDPHARAAAERETLEEVGIRLARAESLGRLDDLQGHHPGSSLELVISAFVYHVADPEPLSLNDEVREAFWFPVNSLLDPDRHVDYPLRGSDGLCYPGILVGEPERHVVWGLTYRFLEVFFQILGQPLSPRWPG